MNARYYPGQGVRLTVYTDEGGFNVMIPDHWTIAAIEGYLASLREFYG